MIKYEEGPYRSFKVIYENGVLCGELLVGDDGFYGFWPEKREGYWTSYILRNIADKIDKLDKPYIDEMNAYYDSQQFLDSQNVKEDWDAA